MHPRHARDCFHPDRPSCSRTKILIDMNPSPDWAVTLDTLGFRSQHWVTIAAPNAPDSQLP